MSFPPASLKSVPLFFFFTGGTERSTVAVAVSVLSAVGLRVMPFLNLASRTSGEDGGLDEVGVEEPSLEVERGEVSPERERGNFMRGINNPDFAEVLVGVSELTGVVREASMVSG